MSLCGTGSPATPGSQAQLARPIVKVIPITRRAESNRSKRSQRGPSVIPEITATFHPSGIERSWNVYLRRTAEWSDSLRLTRVAEANEFSFAVVFVVGFDGPSSVLACSAARCLPRRQPVVRRSRLLARHPALPLTPTQPRRIHDLGHPPEPDPLNSPALCCAAAASLSHRLRELSLWRRFREYAAPLSRRRYLSAARPNCDGAIHRSGRLHTESSRVVLTNIGRCTSSPARACGPCGDTSDISTDDERPSRCGIRDL